MHIPNFGADKRPKIPVTFSFHGRQLNGFLSEVRGKKYWWWLHSSELIDVLIWENGRFYWQSGLMKEMDYFVEVVLSWYE